MTAGREDQKYDEGMRIEDKKNVIDSLKTLDNLSILTEMSRVNNKRRSFKRLKK